MNKDLVKIGEIRDLMTSSGVQKVEIINISINNRITVVDWKSTTSNDFGRTIESSFYEPILGNSDGLSRDKILRRK